MNTMNRNSRTALFALFTLGIVVAFRNRASIQRYLESHGIDTPLDKSGNFVDTVRSKIAKLAGKTEYETSEARAEFRRIE